MVSNINGSSNGATTGIDRANAGRRNDAANSPSGGNAPAAAGSEPSNEQVTLTDLSTRLSRLRESLDNVPEVNQAKVAALREQIQNGTYTVDAREVASRMTSLENLLGGRGR